MKLSDRLKAFRAKLGLKQDEISSKSGVGFSSYQKYELGLSTPGGDAIEGFVRLGLNANWLLTGEGDMLLSPINCHVNEAFYTVAGSAEALKADQNISGDTIVSIDAYPEMHGMASKQQPASVEKVAVKVTINTAVWRNWVGLDYQHIKMITVHGDNMSPSLNHGDQVLVNTAISCFVDDAIYAIQQGELVRFKRIKIRLDGVIEVKNDHQKDGFGLEVYPAIQAANFKIIGRVIPFKFGQFD